MPLFFLDASALVKLYVREPGSDRMVDLARREGVRLALLTFSRVECRSALRRRQRAGEFPADRVELVLSRLDRDMRELYVVQPVDDGVITSACELIDAHALRAHDALQLAGCLRLVRNLPGDGIVFACADRALLDAGRSEALAVLDPTSDGEAT